MNFVLKEKYDIDDLVGIVKRLRMPDGCPWDRVQTHESIRRDFIEEVYEAVEAIDECDSDHLREELGDVLFQVVFHSEIESEKGNYDLSDIIDEVSRKMIIRHPHVFGDVQADTTDEVLSNWDSIKMKTHSQSKVSETMDSVAKTLPSLMRAEKLVKKSVRGGVSLENQSEAFALIEEKLDILKKVCKDEDSVQYEKCIGELLFSITGLCGMLKTDSELSLYNACDRYISRFREFEIFAEKRGVDIQGSDTGSTNQLWKEFNKREKTEENENEQI